MAETGAESTGPGDALIRGARSADVPAIAGLDQRITGSAKPASWADPFPRYGQRPHRFLPAADHLAPASGGLLLAALRAWEFGSPPCGWIFALDVDPAFRLRKIGSRLFDAICARLAESGVDTLRTMLARDDDLNMAFFRSQGMMGGPFIQLEMPLDPRRDGAGG